MAEEIKDPAHPTEQQPVSDKKLLTHINDIVCNDIPDLYDAFANAKFKGGQSADLQAFNELLEISQRIVKGLSQVGTFIFLSYSSSLIYHSIHTPTQS